MKACQFKGCPAHATGALTLHIPLHGAQPLVMFTGRELCEHHIEAASPQAMMSNAFQMKIARHSMQQNGQRPDFDSAWVNAVPLEDPGYVEWVRETQVH